MRHRAFETTASVVSSLLLLLHLAQDLVREAAGPAAPALGYLVVTALVAGVLYGAVAMSDRRAGHAIVIVGALGGAAMPVLHLRTTLGSRQDLFFSWTMLTLGAVSLLALGLAIGALRAPAPEA